MTRAKPSKPKSPAAKDTFAAKTLARVTAAETHLCLGIDPNFQRMPEWFVRRRDSMGPIPFAKRWVETCLLAGQGRCAAVKFQSAFFEAMGHQGIHLLERSVAYARRLGYFVILDAKRCDISGTMAAYGRAAFDVLQADALTIMPSVGSDALTALSPWLADGRGVFVVLMSSNPSAREIQELTLIDEDRQLVDAIAEIFQTCAKHHSLQGSLGFVVGATKSALVSQALARRLRGVPLLTPGIGVQGGAIDDALRGLLKSNPGTLIPMSRSLTLLGDPSAQNTLASIRSWKAYGDAVQARVVENARELRPMILTGRVARKSR